LAAQSTGKLQGSLKGIGNKSGQEGITLSDDQIVALERKKRRWLPVAKSKRII